MKTDKKWIHLARRTATFAIVACCAFALTGCGDDDGDGDGIQGTWTFTTTQDGYHGSNEYELEFNDDGTITSSGIAVWTYSLNGDEVSITAVGSWVTYYTGTYSGDFMSGPWVDTDGDSGDWEATR